MGWRVEFDASAAKELRDLGHADRVRVQRYLRERIATEEDPRRFGKALTGDLQGLWRYRVGHVRTSCSVISMRWNMLRRFRLITGRLCGGRKKPRSSSACSR